MLKAISKIAGFVFVVIVSACSLPPAENASSLSTPIQTIKVTQTQPIHQTLEPTSMRIPNKVATETTKTPMATKTPVVPDTLFAEQCFTEYSSISNLRIPSETLVIQTTKGISLFNFKSQTNKEISGKVQAVSTSPDGKWLVYADSTNQLVELVLQSDKEKPIRISANSSWLVTGGLLWLDNQRIWFPEMSTSISAMSILVLNPFSKEKTLINTDYPGIWPYMLGSSPRIHFGYSSAAYDPSLNFVIFPELDEKQGYFQTLWDRKKKTSVARIVDDGSYGTLPVWNEKDQQFLVVGYTSSLSKNKEWFSVNTDGITRVLTDFETIGKNYLIGKGAKLSPDGKTLAFKIVFLEDGNYPNRNSRLILLDMQTRKAIDTCIPVDLIVWSTDSQYLAISTPLENGIQDRVLLIDRNMKKTYQVLTGDQVFPRGWVIWE